MSQLTLSKKVFLALASLLVMLLLIFAGFSILGLQRGLGPYVAEIEIHRMDWLAEILRERYLKDGGWDKLRGAPSVWPRPPFAVDAPKDDMYEFQRPRFPRPWDHPFASQPKEGSALFEFEPHFLPPPAFFDEEGGLPDLSDSIYRRLELVDTDGRHVAGALVDPSLAARLPLRKDEQIIGSLVLAPREELKSQADRAFLARQSGVIALTGVAGLILALALSWLLARRWFAPIDELTQGAQNIARGRLDTRVPARGSDELALLGRTFNSMAEQLDTIESSRRAWLADVAHELRTPLAAMRAEIEALQDGIRTFDDRTALRLHRQVMRLSQLVDDLRSSMREPEGFTFSRAAVFPLALLDEALALMRTRFLQQGIEIDTQGLAEAAALRPAATADARRLHQVYMNLLENVLAYTDTPGVLRLTANVISGSSGSHLELVFEDSAPGPTPSEMPHLFERLYRGEGSRNRRTGGAGLGLAICRTLIEQHGGTIDATASPLGGLRILILLPLTAIT